MNSCFILTLRLVVSCLYFFTMPGWAEGGRNNHQPSLSELLDNAAHNHTAAIQKIRAEYPAFIEYSDQQIQLMNSGAQQSQISLGEDLLEMAKIIGMDVFAVALYEIAHKLISRKVNHENFVRTNIGLTLMFDKIRIPFVSDQGVITLYIFLGDTIASWKSNLLLAIATMGAARFSPYHYYGQLNWNDMFPFVVSFRAIQIAASTFLGTLSLYASSDKQHAVSILTKTSQLFGKVVRTAIITMSVFYSPPNRASSPLMDECSDFTKTLTKLFKDNPNDPEIQALILFKLNSPIKNCEFA